MRRSVSALGLSLPVAGEDEPLAMVAAPAPTVPARVDDATRYRRDDAGRVVALLAPGSAQWLLFEHGERGELRIRADGGHVYLDAAANVTRLDNGVVEEACFDAAGRPARLRATDPAGGAVLDLRLRYDASGRIREIGGHPIAYDGDAVAGWEVPGDAGIEHDPRGHRSARREPGAPPVTYHHDAGGRLLRVERGGRTVVSYRYDAAGRRVRRSDPAATVHRHYDDAGNLLAETDGDGRALATFICVGARCLARIDGPVGAPAAEWYHLDHAGSAWAVTDARAVVTGRRDGPFDLAAPGPYMRRHRDPATGFFDFGARDFDPATRRFTTPDSYTFDADDPRLRADPRRDPWGGDGPQRGVLRHWEQTPALGDRYAFCLGDPVNNVDLDGHSAWWFFLTIPSSLTWALPNTVIGLIIVIVNLVMEIIGWIAFPFVAAGRQKGPPLSNYPWGLIPQTGTNPPNPYDLDDRNHFWMNFDASPRQGVPWALINGSFCSAGRAFTLGNVVLIEDLDDAANDQQKDHRFVVPNDPDVQLTRQDALRQHEMQHTFQYAYLGPLFHCLPIPLLVRIIENAAQGNQDLIDRTELWKRIDLGGGLTLTVGGLVWLLTGTKVKPEDVGKWIDPATWWQQILPFRWAEIATQAISFNSQLPGLGVYELDMIGRGGQSSSWFERNAGASSGDTYGTVIEAEEDEIFVGQFTRIVGADVRPPVQSVKASRRTITWSVAPDAPLPAGSPGTPAAGGAKLDPTNATNFINLDAKNSGTVFVCNGGGLYFHATAAGTYSVTGTGSSGAGTTSETVKIEVKDIAVTVATAAFVCQTQLIAIAGDEGATYSLKLTNAAGTGSGATLNGLAYTAGSAAGTDTIDVIAHYDASAGPFATYGDNGLAAVDWVVKTLTITVKEPTITPAATEIFVGDSVAFTFDHDPTSAASTANVPGSRYDTAAKTFRAGPGAIAAEQTETITFDYGCRTFAVAIKVKPIVVTAAPPGPLAPGGQAQLSVSGGKAPYRFELASAGTSGPSVDANGAYKAGTTAAAATDVVTVTDANGGRGTLSIAVHP